MKIKITAFLCAAVCLTAMLAGCGTTAPETTAPPETVAATETPTFFEEQGLTMWEGFEMEQDPEVRELRGTQQLPKAYELVFYEKNVDAVTMEQVPKREILGASTEVHVCKYYPEEFETKGISHVADQFYYAELAEREGLTKEEWLTEHANDVLVSCWTLCKIPTAEAKDVFYEDFSEEDYGCSVAFDKLTVMDQYSGEIFNPQNRRLGEVGRFTIDNGSGEVTFSAMYNYTGNGMNAKNSEHQDFFMLDKMYLLVPKDYDGLTVVFNAREDHYSEETLEKMLNGFISGEEKDKAEDAAWERTTYEEYYKDSYIKPYFLDLNMETVEAVQQDTRRPAEYTFLDMLDQKLWESFVIQDLDPFYFHGEIHSAKEGAEVLYFNSENMSADSYVGKAIAGVDMDVYVCDIVREETIDDSFYQAARSKDPSLTREAWEEAHKNDRLLCCGADMTFLVSQANAEFFANHEGQYWSAYWQWPLIVDSYTGKMYCPQTSIGDVVETFDLGNGTGTFSALYRQVYSEWVYTSVGNEYRDLIIGYSIFVLVPEDYDGLTFVQEIYKENRTDDAIRKLYSSKETTATTQKEDSSAWWQGNFYFESDYLKRFYFDLQK